jgi:hypothetical protein
LKIDPLLTVSGPTSIDAERLLGSFGTAAASCAAALVMAIASMSYRGAPWAATAASTVPRPGNERCVTVKGWIGNSETFVCNPV